MGAAQFVFFWSSRSSTCRRAPTGRSARRAGGVELVDSRARRHRIEVELVGKTLYAVIADREDRRQPRHADGIQDRIADLVGLSGDQAPPDGIALRPLLVIEPLGVAVEDDAERHPVDAVGDAAVILARASIATAWHWSSAPTGFTPWSSRLFSTVPVFQGVPHQKILRRLAPAFRQPVEIGFQTTGVITFFASTVSLPASLTSSQNPSSMTISATSVP